MMEKAETEPKLYTRMRLWEYSDQYVIEPTDGSSGSSLSVSRLDGSMKLIDELPKCGPVRVPKIRTIFGVIGMLKLVAGSQLFVITERECVGSYLGHPFFKVSSFKIFPCDQSLNTSKSEQKKAELEFAGLLNVAEKISGLYFSYDVNLTLSAQRLHELGDESKRLPLWRQADPRFLWNNYLLETLVDNKLDPYMLPIVQGSFQHFQAAIDKDIADVTLIARRCTRRNGTRMWRRGADPDGYVANFVETEQILQMNGVTASFVQASKKMSESVKCRIIALPNKNMHMGSCGKQFIDQLRGSMPFLWEQIVDLTYKPKFDIVRPDEAPRIAERHFLDLRKTYKSVLAVDLVNKHGGEGHLCEKYGNTMQQISCNDVRYLHFDFHRICGHVHFERLSLLYAQIADFLEKNGYCLLSEKCEKLKDQLGVVRTNCIDCLDRTNVTQSMIGRKLLEWQLRRIGAFNAEETIDAHPHLDEQFKILWANHGDEISIQYSGTPALKGDFVRHGQRTVEGILKDGWNALLRYYLNNFVDGRKQDAIDLLHGHYIISVNRDMSVSPPKGGIENFASFPAALSVVLVGLFLSFMSLRRGPFQLRYLFFSFVWASMSIAVAAFVKANGRMFCNRPRLHQPR